MTAEEIVRQRYPEAFAWQDDEGHWYISLPHIGESQDDEHEATSDQREANAWQDAAQRIEAQSE